VPSLRLFISHAHEDKLLADALQSLIAGVFPSGAAQTVRVDYSSDDAPRQGIGAGATWLEWIRDVVRADVCVVILTADSVSAPWLTWEAGAVTGVAMGPTSVAGGGGRQATVIPLLFGISVDNVPAPLQQHQAVNGEQPRGILKLLFRLHELSNSIAQFSEESAESRVSRFIREIQDAMQARVLGRPVRLRLSDRSAIHFINSRNGLTLEPRDGEIANGVRLECGKFTGDSHQAWLLYPAENRGYRIITSDKTKCISVENDSKRKRAAIVLWDYEGHETQRWQLISDQGTANALSTVRIVNCASGLCLLPTVGDKQIVQEAIENCIDEDWWILAAPTLPAV